MVNILIVILVILAVVVWAAMTAKELPEDKLDESVSNNDTTLSEQNGDNNAT